MIYTVEMLKNKYSNYSNPLDKIIRDVAEGKLFRITRGLYETDKTVNPMLLASTMISPSYVSFEYALSFYGLIPERVETITVASYGIRKNKIFVNYFGRYEYTDVNEKVFCEGITYYIQDEYYGVKIATKEKAICDALSKWPVIHSVKQLKELLFEDKRIYEEEFESMNFEELVRLANLYKKTNHKYLIKMIEGEYLHE